MLDPEIYSKDRTRFQAKIQIRPRNNEILKFIRNQVKKRKDVLIAKEEFLKEGVDVYLTEQRFARALGKKIKASFNGTLKVTKTIKTRDRMTNRDVYRATVLFRCKDGLQ